MSERLRAMGRNDMPRVIANILDSGACWFVARLVLTFVFWGAALGKIADFPGSVAELAALRIEPAKPMAVLLIVTLLVGSLTILLDRWLWLGCGILSGFLVVAIVLAHPFWTMQDPDRTLHFRVAVEHISLIGGFMALAIAGRLRDLRRG
ncbi:MAG: DoxX family protein [Reyranella sp.]|nr:DoxX family protein [Reyranella sp.]